jgi:lysozyme family protein
MVRPEWNGHRNRQSAGFSMDSKFKAAADLLLGHEGGYRDDPEDPGGETSFGISRRSYPETDIKSLTREQAEAIYYRDWWTAYGYGSISHAGVAAKVLDLAVNLGPARAHKLLQETVNDLGPVQVAVDGRLGPATLAALNSHPHPECLLAALKLKAVRYYLSLGQRKYLAGWVKRAIDG